MTTASKIGIQFSLGHQRVEFIKFLNKKMAACNFLGSENNEIPVTFLECPVCLTVPKKGPIHQCENGHFVCEQCFARLVNKCPVCRKPLFSNRNRFAEAIFDNLLRTCKFGNCEQKMKWSELQNHQENCKQTNNIKCPLCPDLTSLQCLALHFDDKHGFVVDNQSLPANSIKFKLSIKNDFHTTIRYSKMYKITMEDDIEFVVIPAMTKMVHNRHLAIYVFCLAKQNVAKMFEVAITVQTDVENNTATNSKTTSIDSIFHLNEIFRPSFVHIAANDQEQIPDVTLELSKKTLLQSKQAVERHDDQLLQFVPETPEPNSLGVNLSLRRSRERREREREMAEREQEIAERERERNRYAGAALPQERVDWPLTRTSTNHVLENLLDANVDIIVDDYDHEERAQRENADEMLDAQREREASRQSLHRQRVAIERTQRESANEVNRLHWENQQQAHQFRRAAGQLTGHPLGNLQSQSAMREPLNNNDLFLPPLNAARRVQSPTAGALRDFLTTSIVPIPINNVDRARMEMESRARMEMETAQRARALELERYLVTGSPGTTIVERGRRLTMQIGERFGETTREAEERIRVQTMDIAEGYQEARETVERNRAALESAHIRARWSIPSPNWSVPDQQQSNTVPRRIAEFESYFDEQDRNQENTERSLVAIEQQPGQQDFAAQTTDREEIQRRATERNRVTMEAIERNRVAIVENAERYRVTMETAERNRVAFETAQRNQDNANRQLAQRNCVANEERNRVAARSNRMTMQTAVRNGASAQSNRMTIQSAEWNRIARDTAERYRVVMEASERNRMQFDAAERNRVAMENHERNRVAMETHAERNRDRVAMETALSNRLARQTTERNRVAMETHERNRVAMETQAQRHREAMNIANRTFARDLERGIYPIENVDAAYEALLLLILENDNEPAATEADDEMD